MPALDPITQGQVLTNEDLRRIFKVSPQGGMRRSLETNTLVIVSNHVESIYDDRWIGEEFHYTGMGQRGDQTVANAQNKTLAESDSNGVEVHLFEVDQPMQYVYQGRVQLAGEPYFETQPDADGLDRKVVVFPLKLADAAMPVSMPLEEFRSSAQTRERKARRLSQEELLEKASRTRATPGERTVTSVQYERDPYVSQLTKLRANGKCDLCEELAPFIDKNGSPYLETHHIDWLSKGGKDTLDNTVALCPNCHRKMHTLDLDEDRDKLTEKLSGLNDG